MISWDNRRGFRFTNCCISFFLFLIPFCYPFRKIVQHYLPVKEYLIMYLPTVLILLYFVVRQIKISVGVHLFLTGIFYIMMLFFSPDHTTGLMWLINIVLAILITVVLSSNEFRIENALPYCFGTVLCSFLLLPVVIQRFGFSINYINYERIPFMYGDVEVGPNGWSQYLAIAIMLSAMQLIYGENSKRRKTVLLLLLFMEMYFIWITGARGSLVAVIGAFCLTIFFGLIAHSKVFVKKSVILRGVILLTSIIITIVVLLFSNSDFITESRMADLSSGERVKIWRMAIYVFSNFNPLRMIFGIGTGGTGVFLGEHNVSSFGTTVDTNSSISHISSHNSYLDSLIGTGIIGLLLFVTYWGFSIWRIIKFSGKQFYAVFPLFVIIAGIVYNLFSGWAYCACIVITEVVIIRNCPEVHNEIRFVLTSGNRLVN